MCCGHALLCCGWLFSPLHLLGLLTTPSSQLVCGAAASPPDHPVPETHSARPNCMRASAADATALQRPWHAPRTTPLPCRWQLGRGRTACSVQHSAVQCRSVPATTEQTETCCSTAPPKKRSNGPMDMNQWIASTCASASKGPKPSFLTSALLCVCMYFLLLSHCHHHFRFCPLHRSLALAAERLSTSISPLFFLPPLLLTSLPPHRQLPIASCPAMLHLR